MDGGDRKGKEMEDRERGKMRKSGRKGKDTESKNTELKEGGQRK